MTEPKRIQLRRTKGWRLPPGCVVVAWPTKWGNPYRVGKWATVNGEKETVYNHARAVMLFALFAVLSMPANAAAELRGKDLACWCPLVDENGEKVPCHADVLLELANR